MYKSNCLKCDYSAKSSLIPINKKCPVCSSEMDINLDSKIMESLKALKKPKKYKFNINISGVKLKFNNLTEDEMLFCEENSTYYQEKAVKWGIMQEPVLDEDMKGIAVLAKALDTGLSFNHNIKYLIDNFSRTELNIISLKYNSMINKKFNNQLLKVVEEYKDSSIDSAVFLDELSDLDNTNLQG